MSKYINESNTQAFYTMAWISFIVAFSGMLAGIWYLETSWSVKGFLGMAYLFTVSACFTLAKVVRDKQESSRIINKIENAKTERFLNEYADPVKV